MVDGDGAESHGFIDFPNFMTFVPILDNWSNSETGSFFLVFPFSPLRAN
tara:strand:+ start:413 stop:559 length:147 start_codon:yes stop_codon:yes gene_type:complete